MNLLPDVPIQSSSADPLYNIGVVTRMTGISMATLRAWERRYDFPQSGRTLGGHRLYSEKDILRLRWVKERIDGGMQTAQAIQALHRQEETGQFTEALPAAPTGITVADGNATPPGYTTRLIGALAQRDLNSADQILSDALASAQPENVILDIIGPTLAEVGVMWEKGKMDIATEHMATNFLRQKLLVWMVSGPPPIAAPPILLACAPNEWHEGSLLILGALLRRRRWPVVYLGQAVPLPDLAAFIRDTHPSLVILVAMTEIAAADLVDWPKHLPEASTIGKPIVAYGGRVYNQQPQWLMRMPGVFLGASLQQGLETIEKLLKR